MLSIRPEADGDHAAIRAVHIASFPTAAEADLVDALRAEKLLLVSRVATFGDTIVGHVAFSPLRLEGTLDGVGMAPVAVLSSHRRRGIAAQLVHDGLTASARAGHGFVVVLGAPSYYARFGFVPARRFGLRDDFAGGDAFQALELRKDAIPRTGGAVHYAPPFAAFEP